MKYPWLFALVLFVFILTAGLAWWTARGRGWGPVTWVANTAAMRRLPAFQKERSRSRWTMAGATAALAVMIGAVSVSAGLPVERRVEHPKLASRDIVLCLDASGSMLPYDGQILRSFQEMVESFEGERLALQLWSAQTITRFPLTDDYELVSSVLGEAAGVIDRGYLGPEGEYVLVTPELSSYLEGIDAPDGQEIASLVGDGLATCVMGFDNMDSERSRTILLATDNEVMGEQIYTLAEAVETATKADIDIIALYPAVGGVLTAEGEQLRSVVEGAGAGFRQPDRLTREAGGTRPVGVVFAHQTAPAGAGFVNGGVRGQAQHDMGRGLGLGIVAGDDGGQPLGRDAEDLGHVLQHFMFGGVQRAIGGADDDHALDHVVQHRIACREHARDPPRPGVVSGNVLPGQIEDAAGVLFLGPGDGEDAPERGHFRALDPAIGLGHLGGKRDHGNGEGHRFLGWRGRFLGADKGRHAVNDPPPEAARRRKFGG